MRYNVNVHSVNTFLMFITESSQASGMEKNKNNISAINRNVYTSYGVKYSMYCSRQGMLMFCGGVTEGWSHSHSQSVSQSVNLVIQ